MEIEEKYDLYDIYYDTLLTTTINIEPAELNNHILANVFNKLKKTYTNKNDQNMSIIIDIQNIITKDTNHMQIIKKDLTACVRTEVQFYCRCCKIIKNCFIEATCEQINNAFYKFKEGPILIIIELKLEINETYNSNNFEILKNSFTLIDKKTKEEIKVGEKFIIQIINPLIRNNSIVSRGILIKKI